MSTTSFCGFLIVAAAALGASERPVHAQESATEVTSEPAFIPDPAVPNETFSVALDLATITRVPPETATLVIGNPAIADATIQRNGLIVVTGKSYGTTNLLALNRDGATLREMMVHVTAPRDRTITVLRGASRETWSCAPRCEQTVTLGDNSDYFTANSGQIGNRNGLASQR